MGKIVGAAEFKAACLRLIDEVSRNQETVTITKRGKPVAVLSPVKKAAKPKTLFGAMRGSVLRFDDPFSPAVDPQEWNAMRDSD